MQIKINHKYNFIDPESGGNTPKIKWLLGCAKYSYKKHLGKTSHERLLS